MLTSDLLTSGGFRFHHYHENDTRSSYKKGLWQKRIANANNEALYFINIEEYRDRECPSLTPKHRALIHARYRFSIEAQLYTPGGLTMALTLHYDPETMTPATIEAFYAHAHQALGCDLDPHN